MIKRIYWLVFSALLLPVIFHPLWAAEPTAAKHVLVLFSEGRDNPGQEMTGQGNRAGFLSSKDLDIRLFNEYLVLNGDGY